MKVGYGEDVKIRRRMWWTTIRIHFSRHQSLWPC